MNHLSIHRATASDIDTLVKNRILFALELAGPHPEASIAALRQQLTEYFTVATADQTCLSMIATIDAQVAGIGSLHVRNQPASFRNITGKWGYLMNIYTVPEFRKRGVCKSIVNALVAAGTAAGVTAFELHATPAGEGAYRQCGFELFPQPTYRKYHTQKNV